MLGMTRELIKQQLAKQELPISDLIRVIKCTPQSSFLTALLLSVVVFFCLTRACVPNYPSMALLPYLSVMQRSWCWWITRSYLNQDKTAAVVLFGNSQMHQAVVVPEAHYLNRNLDNADYRRASMLENKLKRSLGAQDLRVFNAASGGLMLSDQWMMSHVLFGSGRIPSLVVLSVAPRDFIDDLCPSASSTEPFMFYSNFVDPPWNDSSANLFDKFERSIARVFPLSWVRRKAQCFMGCTQGAVSADQSIEVKRGQYVTPPNVPTIFFDDTTEYVQRHRKPGSLKYADQLAYFTSTLDYLHSLNIQVLIVTLPLLKANRDLLPPDFWLKFNYDLSAQSRNHDLKWLNLADSALFDKEDFMDNVHLNARGGEKVMEILSRHAPSGLLQKGQKL